MNFLLTLISAGDQRIPTKNFLQISVLLLKRKDTDIISTLFLKMADNKCRNASLLLVEEELLSEEVRCFPCIFDKADKAYKERDTVRNAWDEVAKKLDFRLLKIIRSSNFFFRRTLSAMLLLLFTIPVKTKVVFVHCSCRYFEILNTIMHTMLIVPLSFCYRSVKTKLNWDRKLINSLKDVSGAVCDKVDVPSKSNNIDELNDPDTLFCKSLVSTLEILPQRKNKQAKIKIQQLLFELEFDE